MKRLTDDGILRHEFEFGQDTSRTNERSAIQLQLIQDSNSMHEQTFNEIQDDAVRFKRSNVLGAELNDMVIQSRDSRSKRS